MPLSFFTDWLDWRKREEDEMSDQWSPEVKSRLKSILSITRPKASNSHECAWCGLWIERGRMYVRVVWQETSRLKHSDHICVDCWEREPSE